FVDWRERKALKHEAGRLVHDSYGTS
ncbi:MAG: hypothetical protein RLZZ15_1697, partial [Verrucomicrobiota bacterium]